MSTYVCVCVVPRQGPVMAPTDLQISAAGRAERERERERDRMSKARLEEKGIG